MQGKKEMDFIKWFSELNKNSGKVAGGKGANLAEIYNLKVPVPPGFVVTAQAYDYFIKEAKLDGRIKDLVAEIDYEDTEKLDILTKQIRALIINSKFPKEMETEILEAYADLSAGEYNLEREDAIGILSKLSEPIFVAVRSSATTEDLADASFAGQQDSFVNVKGNSELLSHIRKCFASLFTSRATYYRNKKGFAHAEASLAVVVQKMVDSDKSGVVFSKDPSYKNDNIIIEAVWGLGEGIVSGSITPDKYVLSSRIELLEKKISNKKIAITRDSGGNKQIVKLKEERAKQQVLTDYEIRKLSEIAKRLEEHYQKPQDIEFAVENSEIYIVQTRPITTIETRIEKRKDLSGELILTGLAASPGIASGRIKIVEDLADLSKISKGDILVTKMTNPDMVVTMQKSAAIVTDEGGMTAHAAIVSREMGIPCVVGTQEATTRLKEGEIITVDGFSGKIYKGKIAETTKKEVLPVTATTKIKIKVMVDLPSFAERASQTGIRQVGLTRLEGIIAEAGKHPEYFLKKEKMRDYEEIIFNGVTGIAHFFDELWVRTSDIRSDEFQNLDGAPKEKEANPMLGLHGIRYGIKKPEILKAELNALKRVADKNKEIGVLLPQIISVDEIKKVKELLKEINFSTAKVGIMIETPAAVQMIKEFCEEGIDFISFGTNDLTQYMLAVDRGNKDVQDIYDEMHPAVLYQLEYVIRVCKRNSVETSICGQAGSKKEMVKFLVEKGIDSISVNADAAKEISDYVAELENALLKGTDKEPRQYHLKKSSEEIIKRLENSEPPEIRGVERFNAPTYIVKGDEEIEKDIEAIEEEKKEYLEENTESESIDNSEEEKFYEEPVLTNENYNDETPEFTEEESKDEAPEEEESEFSEGDYEEEKPESTGEDSSNDEKSEVTDEETEETEEKPEFTENDLNKKSKEEVLDIF